MVLKPKKITKKKGILDIKKEEKVASYRLSITIQTW